MGIFSAQRYKDDQDPSLQNHDKRVSTQLEPEVKEQLKEGSQEEPAIAPGQLPEQSTVSGTGQDAGKTVEIVVNGPLGHIYTQALNLLMAKEDMASSAVLGLSNSDDGIFTQNGDMFSGTVETEESETDKAYVYVTDAGSVDFNEMNAALDDIDRFFNENPDGAVVLGLENATHTTVAADRLVKHAMLGRSIVMCSRSGTLNAIKRLCGKR